MVAQVQEDKEDLNPKMLAPRNLGGAFQSTRGVCTTISMELGQLMGQMQLVIIETARIKQMHEQEEGQQPTYEGLLVRNQELEGKVGILEQWL